MSARVRESRHRDQVLRLLWTSSFDDVLSHNRQYAGSRRSREQLERTRRSRNTCPTSAELLIVNHAFAVVCP